MPGLETSDEEDFYSRFSPQEPATLVAACGNVVKGNITLEVISIAAGTDWLLEVAEQQLI
jgi:hypothetical protein